MKEIKPKNIMMTTINILVIKDNNCFLYKNNVKYA